MSFQVMPIASGMRPGRNSETMLGVPTDKPADTLPADGSVTFHRCCRHAPYLGKVT